MASTEQEVKNLKQQVEDLQESLIGSSDSEKENIYSPKAQVPFKEYKGTIEDYKEEARLRKVASGRKDTFTSQTMRFVAAAVFGDKDIADEIRARFQKRYSKEDIEDAEKQLERDFGIKKKIKEDKLVTRKIKNIIRRELSPINKSIAGFQGAVKSVGEDVKRAENTIKSIDKFLISTITQLLGVLTGKRGELDNTPDRIKPMTVSGEEGKEYLFYPNAPEGRQLYEKSKTGTAGRIASKKIQRKLEKELKKAKSDSDVAPLRSSSTGIPEADAIVERIKILLEEESMFRKRDMEMLVEDLKQTLLEKKKSSIFDAEADEQEKMMANAMETALNKTLYNSLKKVFEENPELLQSGGLLDGILPFSFGRRNNVTPVPPTTPENKGTIKEKLKQIFTRTGGARGLAGPSALAIGATALAATAATGAIFGTIDYGLKQSGEKAIRNISRGSAQDIATAIQVPKYGAYTLQQLEKMAMDDPTLRQKLDQAKGLAGLKPVTPSNLTLTQPRPAAGQQIVDQNQKRIEIQSADRVEIPSQTVNQINNTSVIPIPAAQKNIQVHNQENTFNRLLAQEFDHPATYASMNMG